MRKHSGFFNEQTLPWILRADQSRRLVLRVFRNVISQPAYDGSLSAYLSLFLSSLLLIFSLSFSIYFYLFPSLSRRSFSLFLSQQRASATEDEVGWKTRCARLLLGGSIETGRRDLFPTLRSLSLLSSLSSLIPRQQYPSEGTLASGCSSALPSFFVFSASRVTPSIFRN